MSLEDAINRLAAAVEKLIPNAQPPRPGILNIRVISERHTDMADFLTFVVAVPAAEGDVVKRKVTVELPGGELLESEIDGKDATESGGFEVLQDSLVKVSCVNVDDAGNESEPREQEFTIADTIAPAAPSELGVRVTAERTE